MCRGVGYLRILKYLNKNSVLYTGGDTAPVTTFLFRHVNIRRPLLAMHVHIVRELEVLRRQ